MLTIVWRKKKLTTNAHKFIFAGDKKYVGQNLGLYGQGGDYFPDKVSFKWVSDGWYSECQYMTNNNVKSYYPTTPDTDHFTQQVVDKNNEMGCNCLKYQDGVYFFTNWCCDFGRGTFVYFPVFQTITNGQVAGDGCTTGKDNTYTSLCGPNESIDLNAMDWSQFDWDSYHAHNP